jgi:type IV pilus assembly protein PilW
VKRQFGFSLVELMVAITLGLLLTGAVISVFIGSRAAYQSTSGVGEMADSGRFALNLIGESVRSAGNIACNSAMSATSQSVATGVPSLVNNYGQGITGYESIGTTPPGAAIALPANPVPGAPNNWTPNLDPDMTAAIPAPPNPGQPVQGSDVLVVRSSVPRVAPVYTTLDVAPGAATLAVTPLPVAMLGGGYVAVSDCTKSVIFSLASQVAARATAVNLNAPLIGVGFSAGAVVAPLTTTVYYIGTGSDGDSALWRLEQVNGGPPFAAEELVPDVENMQVLYGVDSNPPTQTATAYVTADQVGPLNVVSIQVAVLVASPPGNKLVPAPLPFNLLGTSVTVPGDNRARKVFYATINLRDAVN